MDAIILFAWRARERIGGWVDDLFHAPFWKVMAGAVIATLSLFAVSALVNPGRNKIKPAALLGGLGLAACDLARASGRGCSLG